MRFAVSHGEYSNAVDGRRVFAEVGRKKGGRGEDHGVGDVFGVAGGHATVSGLGA